MRLKSPADRVLSALLAVHTVSKQMQVKIPIFISLKNRIKKTEELEEFSI